MRARKGISVLALLCVLLHAGAIVRHNAAMTTATLQYQALVTGLTQICHGSATPDVLAAAELPYVPRPSDAQNGCPICSGLSPALALAQPNPAALPARPPAAVSFWRKSDIAAASAHAVCPPARAPPSVA